MRPGAAARTAAGAGGGGTVRVPKQSGDRRRRDAFTRRRHRFSLRVTHVRFRDDVAGGAQTFESLVRQCDGRSGNGVGVRIENGFDLGQEGAILRVGQVEGESD